MKKTPSAPLYALLTLFLTGTVLLEKDIYGAGKNVIPPLFLAACISAAVFTLVIIPFLKYPYLRAEDCFRLKTGEAGKKLFLIVFFLFALFSAASLYSDYLRFLSAVVLDATPDLISSALKSAFILFTAFSGLRALSYFGSFVFILWTAFCLFMFVEGLGFFKPETVAPFFQSGAADIMITALKLSFGFLSDVLLSVLLIGRECDGRSLYKTSLAAFASWFILTAAVGLLPSAFFGDSLTLFNYPVFQTLSAFRNVSFMPKCGFGFAVITFMIVVVKLTALCAVCGRALAVMVGTSEKGKTRLILYAVPLLFVTVFSHVAVTSDPTFENALFEVKSALSAILPAMFSAIMPFGYKRNGHRLR